MSMDFKLRAEHVGDNSMVAALLDDSFGGQYESALVARVRETQDYAPELTLVAEQAGAVVGFIMLSYVYLDSGDAKAKVLALGPVAVVPSHQKSGIGGALIRETIKIANARKEPLIVLLGHETYYQRFGFERASLHGIRPPVDWEDGNFMILKLDGYHDQMQGTIRYSDAWQIE